MDSVFPEKEIRKLDFDLMHVRVSTKYVRSDHKAKLVVAFLDGPFKDCYFEKEVELDG